MIGIYKIVNPLGEVYIGKSIDIKSRERSYNNIGGCINQPKLLDSMYAYGRNNHKFEIIEECDVSIIDEREKFWINYFDTFGNGLNCTDGGIDGKKSDETKDKIRKKLIGGKRSEETKIKMSQSKINHSMYNDDWRKIMREKTWNKNKAPTKKVNQYSLDGDLIREFDSLKEASLHFNKNNSAELSRHLNGTKKTAYGYKWKYKECIRLD